MLHTLREKLGLDVDEVFKFDGYDYECWFGEKGFYYTVSGNLSASERDSLQAKLLGWLVLQKPIKFVTFEPTNGDTYFTFEKNKLGHWIVVSAKWENSTLDCLRAKSGWVFSSSKRATEALREYRYNP